MNELKYRCPFCNTVIAIQDSQIGQQINCSKCDRPIRIDAPSATVVNDEAVDKTVGGEAARRPTHEEEELLARVHPALARAKPISVLLAGCCILAGLVVMVMGLSFLGDIIPKGDGQASGGSDSIGLIVGGILVAIGVCWMGILYVQNMSTTLEITTNRTRLIHGLIAKNSTEVQHDDVRNLQVSQTLIQRMINVGDLAVSSSGQDDLEIYVKGISNPNKLADEIRKRQ